MALRISDYLVEKTYKTVAHRAFGSILAYLDKVSGQTGSRPRARIHLRLDLYEGARVLECARFLDKRHSSKKSGREAQ